MSSPCWGDVAYPVTQPWLPGPPAIHCGIDIGCPPGTIIRAARAGVVETVQTGMVGIHVTDTLERDFYLHGYTLVVVGQHVDVGTPVIHSDTVQVDPRYPLTGPHLHFEVQDGYTLPGAPPQYPEHSLDPVPILLGVATVGEQPWNAQGTYQDWLTQAGLRIANWLKLSGNDTQPDYDIDQLKADIQEIKADLATIKAGVAPTTFSGTISGTLK